MRILSPTSHSLRKPGLTRWGLIGLFSLTSFLTNFPAHAETLTDGQLYVTYSGANEALAKRTLNVAKQAVAELSDRLPAGHAPIRINICATRDQFRHYAGIYTQPKVTGIAQSEAGIIAIKTPTLSPGGSDYDGTVRHELTHVLLARNVDPANLPRWLNEGIAMTVSHEFRWGSRFHVADMYLHNQIINYSDLDFELSDPGSGMEFGDAYAQSLSMTHFLMDHMSKDAFWNMVLSLRRQDFPHAIREYAHWTPQDFFRAWRRSLWKLAWVSTLVSGFSLFQVMAILALLAYWRARRRRVQALKQWEQEEAEEDYYELSEEDVDPWDLYEQDEDDAQQW